MQLSELLYVTISIPPCEIERLLDALAQLPHHINPDLRYEARQTHVEFPAWRSWLNDLYDMVTRENLPAVRLRYRPAVAV